jgi:hypothetical protein
LRRHRFIEHNGDRLVQNDKAFAVAATVLFAGLASVLTASVLVGFAALPAPLVFLEHVAMGLAMRASYKFIGGWNWADWTLTSEPASEFEAPVLPTGTAGAEG